MAQKETYGIRDYSYSAWHRSQSTSRYVSADDARKLAMVDLDVCPFVEYADGTKEPVALIETAVDLGQNHKTATVTKRLAEKAGIPAFVVLYTLADADNPADGDWRDIYRFRVKRLCPDPQSGWDVFTPRQYAEWLLRLRQPKPASRWFD